MDKSRSALSHTHSTSSAPAPSLSPATIAASNSCKVIIEEILHSNEANPNTLHHVNARDDDSLVVLAKTTMAMLKQRQQTLVKYLTQAEKGEIQVSVKVKKLWTEKLDATNVILTVLVDADKPESKLDEKAKANRQAFFKTAKQAWETNLSESLMQLSKEMAGPYALGKNCLVVFVKKCQRECIRRSVLDCRFASCLLVDKSCESLRGNYK